MFRSLEEERSESGDYISLQEITKGNVEEMI